MNPFLSLFRTIFLFLGRRVVFFPEDTGRVGEMEDGGRFRVFRHVRIRGGGRPEPGAAFIVRFQPKGMKVQENICFSVLPMMVLLGFRGFREKYWCVNDDTGLCQGVYAWQSRKDAEDYSRSIAMQFMAGRSLPGSVEFRILDQGPGTHWLLKEPPQQNLWVDSGSGRRPS